MVVFRLARRFGVTLLLLVGPLLGVGSIVVRRRDSGTPHIFSTFSGPVRLRNCNWSVFLTNIVPPNPNALTPNITTTTGVSTLRIGKRRTVGTVPCTEC